MSDTASNPSRDAEQAEGSRFTVEDAGSTTRPSDLFHNDSATGAVRADTEGRDAPTAEDATARDALREPSSAGATDAGSTSGRSGLPALDDDPGHVFDQTNGMIDRLEGDSDGSAEGDVLSAEDRAEEDPMFADAAVHGESDAPEERRTGD